MAHFIDQACNELKKNINIEFFGSEQNEWKNVWLSLIHVLFELLNKNYKQPQKN